MPTVPISPEPLEALQARYPRALEHVYDQEHVGSRGGIRPGEVAAQLFDFEDGLRLMVSRERTPAGATVLHFSASFTEQGALADEVRRHLRQGVRREELWRRWLAHVPVRFSELSGDVREPEYWGRTDGGIPHWMITEEVRGEQGR